MNQPFIPGILIFCILLMILPVSGEAANISSPDEGGTPQNPPVPPGNPRILGPPPGDRNLTPAGDLPRDRAFMAEPSGSAGPWMYSNPLADRGGIGETLTPLTRVFLSTVMMMVILLLVILTGLRIGRTYHYDCCEKTRRWAGIGHLLSAGLIAIPIWIIWTIRTGTVDPFFLDTMYGLSGILFYLLLSSLTQGISMMSSRPVPPLYHIHILFVFLAISLILMGRIPFFPPLPNTILAITAVFLPGAVLSLISIQITRKRENTNERDPAVTLSHPLSITTTGRSSSFPDLLLTRYRDVSLIGTGGVAVVYRATRIADGHEVAVKIPFSADEISGKTFFNEMSVWQHLHHPYIVKISDQNIFPVPFVEMEYLPGSLRDITLPVPPDRAVAIISDIASAVAYAHKNGVIHRDIKPGNVLISDDGTAKLTDWGLSRSISRSDETTNTSFSLYYATPEQLAPDLYGSGDERTDIYQIGILLYELICGHPPYRNPGVGELFMAIRKNRYPLPSEISSSLAPFDAVIIRALKASPDERFSSVEAFLACLKK